MSREAQATQSRREFVIGDRVLVREGTNEIRGKIGHIGRAAHPASPWRWVVYSEPGDGFWGTAVNEKDIEHVD